MLKSESSLVNEYALTVWIMYTWMAFSECSYYFLYIKACMANLFVTSSVLWDWTLIKELILGSQNFFEIQLYDNEK